MSLAITTALPRVATCGMPVTILLVDDDPDCRQLTRDAIEQCTQGQARHAIYEVSSGEEALAFLNREGLHAGAPRPGLIYMDVEMSGMGGHEALRAIRADKRFADIPIVMMTGVTADEQKRRAMQLGANSYTNKSANASEFMRTVMQATDYWTHIHQHPARMTA